ncbi:uncharacterized protein LOC111125586 isoform X2 [Crassostrea virginica]
MNVPLSIKVTYILIFLLIQRSEPDCLESSSAGTCCVDYYFKDGTCKPCNRGYYGPNFEHTCPYPSYGYRCVEGKCDCPLLQCDFSVGCVEGGLPTSTDSLQLPSEKLSTLNIFNITLTTASNKMSDGRNSYDDNPNDIDMSSLLMVVIISSSSSIAVSVVVVVIVVCRRTKRLAKEEKRKTRNLHQKKMVGLRLMPHTMRLMIEK